MKNLINMKYKIENLAIIIPLTNKKNNFNNTKKIIFSFISI